MIFRLGRSINRQINSPFPHMSPSIHKQMMTQSFSNIPLCSNIQKSTFPHQPKAGGPPFSPERETFEPLPLSIQIHSVRLRCLFSPRYLYLRQKRKASKIFPSLVREGKGRKLCLLSANSYGIWNCVKRNVFFLQRVRMQKLIHRSMQNVFLSGERGGMTTRACRHWL